MNLLVLDARLEANSIPEPNSGCWLWTGALDERGYGWFGYGTGRMTRAHIASYKNYRGAVPHGKELHHTCSMKSCINPDHLVALTRLEHKRVHKLIYCRSGRHLMAQAKQCLECKREYAAIFGARNTANYRARKGAAK